MQQAVILKLPKSGRREIHGTTHDVSEIGVRLISDTELLNGARVGIVLTLQQNGMLVTRLSSSGKVTRMEAGKTGKRMIAVECEHPFEQNAGAD